MWIVFGVIAIIATFANLYLFRTGRNYQFAMALGLSFTALTLVSGYSMVSGWIASEDWVALSDVVPTMSIALWILTLISIGLNIAPASLELKK